MSLNPVPIRASKIAISDYAEKVAIALAFKPGDPVEPLVARLGGKINYKNARVGDDKPESIVVSSQNDFIIFLPTMTSSARDRFTVAHELGHLFLHYPRVASESPGQQMVATRWVDDTDPEQQRAEWEANWFAAAFLMPKQAFVTALAQHGGDIDEVAEIFAVSIQAARIRSQSLGR